MLNLLFTKQHKRYKFPAEFANTRLSGNKVNSATLTKMSTALATWRAAVKRRRSVGDRFTVSAVTVTKGTPLGRRRNLDTRAI